MSEETTPRPWEIQKDDMGSWWVIDRNGQQRVAYIGHESDARALGDAKLIVAAVNASATDALDRYMSRLVTAYSGEKEAP